MDNQIIVQLWHDAQKKLPLAIVDQVNKYLNITYKDNLFPCPYWRDKTNSTTGERIRGFLGGKGTAEEVQSEIDKLFSNNTQDYSIEQAVSIIKQNRIGVDCSGLAYNLANLWQIELTGESVDTYITPTAGGNLSNPKRFRTSADSLTSQWNSTIIEDINDIKSGDFIRMKEGKHVLIVLSLQSNMILYIHSDDNRISNGVHLGIITISTDSKKLNTCIWQEFTSNNGLVDYHFFNPDRGDGITRFHWWQ